MITQHLGAQQLDDPMRIHFITSASGSNINFFRESENVKQSDYYVVINGVRTTQNIDSISFSAGDDIIIQRKRRFVKYPLFRPGSVDYSLKPLDYILELLETLPPLYRSGSDNTSYASLFSGCTTLRRVPDILFHPSEYTTTINGIFRGCTALISVSGDLFKNLPRLKIAGHAFSFSGLRTIPNSLFKFAPDLESLYSTFANTQIEEIPEDLFLHNSNIIDVSNIFSYCKLLTRIPEKLFHNCSNITNIARAFEYTDIIEIPSKFFCHSPKITNVSSTFTHTKITSIPSGIFDNLLDLVTAESCFSSTLISPETIPSYLFYYNKKLTNADGLFSSCKKLTTVPATIFRGATAIRRFKALFSYSGLVTVPDFLFCDQENLENIIDMFYRCSNLTHVPEELFASNDALITIDNFFVTNSSILQTTSLYFSSKNISAPKDGLFLDCDINMTIYVPCNSSTYDNLSNICPNSSTVNVECFDFFIPQVPDIDLGPDYVDPCAGVVV